MKKKSRKSFLYLVLILLLLVPYNVSAMGTPTLYESYTTNSISTSTIYVNNTKYDGQDSGMYYKVLWTSPIDLNFNYYGTVTISSYYLYDATPILLGWDGVQWSNISTGETIIGNGGTRTISLIIEKPGIKQIKLATRIASGSTQAITALNSSSITYSLYTFGVDPQDVLDAKSAAQNAESAANAAKSAAEATNTIVNNALTISAGVIQDSSGTVLSEARLAKAKADLAATNAANAKTAADNAKASADNAATKAGQAVTSITTAESNLTTKLNNVESKLNTVQTNLTNISTLLPPILSDVTGYNSATATTSTSFKVSLDYSNATEYRYKLDTGAWSVWTSLSTHDTDGYLTIPVSTNGAHTLSIEIQNSSTSLTAKGKMTFFKL